MTVRLKFGNLFTTDATAIGHGVNVKGVMGAGVAKVFAERYPEMKEAYVERCDHGELHPGELFPWIEKDGTFILNLATQNLPGRYARLEWVESSVRAAGRYCVANKVRSFAIPMIGCGIGGLTKEAVLPSIVKIWDSFPQVDLEIWTLDQDDLVDYGDLFDETD